MDVFTLGNLVVGHVLVMEYGIEDIMNILSQLRTHLIMDLMVVDFLAEPLDV